MIRKFSYDGGGSLAAYFWVRNTVIYRRLLRIECARTLPHYVETTTDLSSSTHTTSASNDIRFDEIALLIKKIKPFFVIHYLGVFYFIHIYIYFFYVKLTTLLQCYCYCTAVQYSGTFKLGLGP